ncbi:MAG: 30S ribosomal protein S21 [bacterium]|nr:30S ribosomal protein S21 [bacterium]
MINAEVSKSGSETAISTIRKFSRKVRGAGLIRTVRDKRYFERVTSKIVKKKRTLKSIQRRKEYNQLLKEGKITEEPKQYGHARSTFHGAESQQTARPSIPAMPAHTGQVGGETPAR